MSAEATPDPGRRLLPPTRRDHLATLAGLGPVAQHARLTIPDPRFGSCTDDVARALEVDLLHGAVLGWDAVAGSAWAALGYLDEALVDASGRFRNFRHVDGTWLEPMGSEDAHGRAVLTLGRAIATAPERAFRDAAAGLFRRSLPGTLGLRALRARSSALIGCAVASLAARATGAPSSAWLAAGRRLATSLAADFEPVRRSSDWPWPEPVLTYESALVPRALVIGGRWMGDRELIATGLVVNDWLAATSIAPAGHLSPVGNHGWWPHGGTRARFDQQPIEAASMLLAAEAAFDATGDPRYLADAERAYGWFVGANDLGCMVADPATGGCRDGLQPDGCNLNQGAESTLAWLLAVERMRILRGRWSALALRPPSWPSSPPGRRAAAGPAPGRQARSP